MQLTRLVVSQKLLMKLDDALRGRVRAYKTLAGMQKKQALDDILAEEGALNHVYAMVFSDDQRASLRVLADACRKKRCQVEIKPLIVRDSDKLLHIQDDKARKTASIVIGLCAPDACADVLKDALIREKTRFVRPSIILALGNTATPEKYLSGYEIEPGEGKHVREEASALKKALSKSQINKAPLTLSLPQWCALMYMNRRALTAELEEKGCRFKSRPRTPGTIDVMREDIKKLRCYVDALYSIGVMDDFKGAAQKLDDYGCKGHDYRIEAGSYRPAERRDIIRRVSDGMVKFGYNDNPSAYAYELRIIRDSIYAVFPQTGRFSYRKQAIPASIHPVTAASVVQLCKPYMKENADVLDPFCGSGTLLIERGIAKKTQSLVGVDISPAAIKAACANRAASGLKMAFIRGDILGYGAAQYDEIISNMPFGIRVSGHSENVKLYRQFADKLIKLLKDDGTAFLYTQEKRLLRDVIAAKQMLSIVKEENFEAGGLCPTLFIIRKGK